MRCEIALTPHAAAFEAGSFFLQGEACHKTEALIKAVKSLKVSTQEDRMIRGMMLTEIESRKGIDFTDSLMSEIGM